MESRRPAPEEAVAQARSRPKGYLPIDNFGADCLFQIISHRYERGATLLTTNRIYKQKASIFNGDATLTSALLDRLLDHVETVLIEGKSYRGHRT